MTMKSIFVVLATVILIGCDEYQVPSKAFPRVQTRSVTSTGSNIKMEAEVVYRGNSITEYYGFIWSRRENQNINSADSSVLYFENLSQSSITATVSKSAFYDSTYFMKPVIKTKDYIIYGNTLSFLP